MKNLFFLDRNFLKYVRSSEKIPADKRAEKFAKLMANWEINSLKIMTWIYNSIDQSIGVHSAKIAKAKDIWDYLSSLYVQSNFSKRYQLGLKFEQNVKETRPFRSFTQL